MNEMKTFLIRFHVCIVSLLFLERPEDIKTLYFVYFGKQILF